MTDSGQTGFIGGGRMAEALIKGMTGAGIVSPEQIVVSEPVADRREFLAAEYGVRTVDCADSLWECGVIIAAVKPQILPGLLREYAGSLSSSHLLVSIAAGIGIGLMRECLGDSGVRIVRVMPNTPALVLEGAAAISPAPGVAREDVDRVVEIFSAVGRAVVVDEAWMDAVTGLSGSGPAYVFSFMEALVDGGVKMGLSREVAAELAVQTVLGAAVLARESGMDFYRLKSMVTSPGGTTIAGLSEMARAGFSGIVMDAVEAATLRSEELGRS